MFLIDRYLLKIDLTIKECEQLLLRYIGNKEEEPCKHNFVDNVCIHCGDCENEFVENVCINSEEETEGVINCERALFSNTNKPKQNTALPLIELRNLNFNSDKFSSAFEMYQHAMKNNIYRSKLRKSILCACICIPYMKK